MRAIRRFIATMIALFGGGLSIGLVFTPGSVGVKVISILIVAVPAWVLWRLFWPKPKPPEEPRPVGGFFDRIEAQTTRRESSFAPRGAFREYRIEYADYQGVVTERDIYVLAIDADDPDMIKAWCFDRDDTRSFRSSRVIEATHLPTGRRVKDLARHYLDHA